MLQLLGLPILAVLMATAAGGGVMAAVLPTDVSVHAEDGSQPVTATPAATLTVTPIIREAHLPLDPSFAHSWHRPGQFAGTAWVTNVAAAALPLPLPLPQIPAPVQRMHRRQTDEHKAVPTEQPHPTSHLMRRHNGVVHMVINGQKVDRPATAEERQQQLQEEAAAAAAAVATAASPLPTTAPGAMARRLRRQLPPGMNNFGTPSLDRMARWRQQQMLMQPRSPAQLDEATADLLDESDARPIHQRFAAVPDWDDESSPRSSTAGTMIPPIVLNGAAGGFVPLSKLTQRMATGDTRPLTPLIAPINPKNHWPSF